MKDDLFLSMIGSIIRVAYVLHQKSMVAQGGPGIEYGRGNMATTTGLPTMSR